MNGKDRDKPYKRYRASRLRRPHAGGDLLEAPPEPKKRTTQEDGDGARRHSAAPRRTAGRVTDSPTPAKSARAGNGDKGAGAGLELAPEPEPRSRQRWFRWWYLLLIPLPVIVVVTVWAVMGYREFDKAVAKSNRRIDRATRAALTKDAGSLLKHPTIILVLGSDQRGTDAARSDTILLLRFNPKTHSVAQLSIPRDTLAPVEGHDQTKINEAYFWGGAPLAVKTVRQFTGLPINHIMIVSFRGFPRMIDAVGGVTVNVPATVTSWYPGGKTVTFKKGPQHMDGATALVYSRIRKSDDDFHRMARQQQVVQALKQRITGPGNLVHLPWIGADFMSGVRTELSTNQLIELAYLQWRTDPKHQYKWVMSGTSQMINGGSYVVVDPQTRDRAVRLFLSK
jgi:LCP family protein required for cell wall assembly